MPHLDHGLLPFQDHGPPASRQSSYDGAKAIEPIAPMLRQRLLDYYRDCGEHGSTDAETEGALGWRAAQICGRRNELLARGQVVALIQRRKNPRTGVRVTAWVAVECL